MRKTIILVSLISIILSSFVLQTSAATLNKPIVGMARTATGNGYWMVASDGGIFSYGDAKFYGSAGNIALNKPIVGMAARPQGDGYWLVASDGGIFTYGAAPFKGSTGGMVLNKPIVGMASTPSGNGYWLVASDGGIFTFGDAGFYGSAVGKTIAPIVGISARPTGKGYWMVASNGGIFTFGDAPFYGSAGNIILASPIVGMASTPNGNGYWLVARDGGIFTYGAAGFYGSAAGQAQSKPVAGMAASATGAGYWIVNGDAMVSRFGDAPSLWPQTDELTVGGFRVKGVTQMWLHYITNWSPPSPSDIFMTNEMYSYVPGTNTRKPIYYMRPTVSLWATSKQDGKRHDLGQYKYEQTYSQAYARVFKSIDYDGGTQSLQDYYTNFDTYGYSKFMLSASSATYQITTRDSKLF